MTAGLPEVPEYQPKIYVKGGLPGAANRPPICHVTLALPLSLGKDWARPAPTKDSATIA